MDARDRELEGVVGVAVLFKEGPGDDRVDVVHVAVGAVGDVAHDGVDRLALVVAVLALDDVLGRDAALGEVDVALVLVDAHDDDDLVAADADELLDRADAPPRELG